MLDAIVIGCDLMIAGAVVMTTAVVSEILTRQVPGLPLEKINKVMCFGAFFGAALHNFIALRRM